MADTFNLKKSYAAMNARLTALFDESGVKRSFTVPYIDGEDMSDHINTVGQVATQVGGLGANLLTSAHHAGGKGWGSGEGHTVGHPADKLRETIIPKNDQNAKAVITAAQTHLNQLKSLLGAKSPEAMMTQGQLDLVKPTNAAGMNLFDFGTMMTQIMYRPTQALARSHNGSKPHGGANVQLSAPHDPQAAAESQPEAAGAAPGEESTQQAPQAAAAVSAAPAAGAAPSGAPTPQAQG